MDTKDDGGPAFPRDGLIPENGMTLRDWFAANERGADHDFTPEVAVALMTTPEPPEDAPAIDQIRWWALAEAKYKFFRADMMIEARK